MRKHIRKKRKKKKNCLFDQLVFGHGQQMRICTLANPMSSVRSLLGLRWC
ncbi:hypothetical protein T11_15595 [Trichinella zimbabwensis]|uniref:Uncharacterized protein n=1 Tax=Trichinella zimbabwensis TaxID=268475 RepID=A0A0V1HPW8_9BILA|nr:hypothetical protein T11_15595 [Trichinella zimbabwensis]